MPDEKEWNWERDTRREKWIRENLDILDKLISGEMVAVHVSRSPTDTPSRQG